MTLTNTPTNAPRPLQTPCKTPMQTPLQTQQTTPQTPYTHTPHTPQGVCAPLTRAFCPPANTAALALRSRSQAPDRTPSMTNPRQSVHGCSPRQHLRDAPRQNHPTTDHHRNSRKHRPHCITSGQGQWGIDGESGVRRARRRFRNSRRSRPRARNSDNGPSPAARRRRPIGGVTRAALLVPGLRAQWVAIAVAQPQSRKQKASGRRGLADQRHRFGNPVHILNACSTDERDCLQRAFASSRKSHSIRTDHPWKRLVARPGAKLIDRRARWCPGPAIFFWFSSNPPIFLRPEIFQLRGSRNA
jgi:hypothetical protein